MPASYDLTIQRGNNAPLTWRFRQSPSELLPLAGSEFVLTIASRFGGLAIRKDSAVDAEMVIDYAASTLTWTPALADTRRIPCGKLSLYELERRVGSAQRTLVAGAITGVGGLGDD